MQAAMAWPPASPGAAPGHPQWAGGDDGGDDVTYSCEHCRAKFTTYDAAEQHELRCPMGPQVQAAQGAIAAVAAAGAPQQAWHGMLQHPSGLPLPPPHGLAPPPPGMPPPGMPPLGTAGPPGAPPGGFLPMMPGMTGPSGPPPGMYGMMAGAPPMGKGMPCFMGGPFGMMNPALARMEAERGAGDAQPPMMGRMSTLQADPPGQPGLRAALMDFRRRWDIELRFESRMVEHLTQRGAGWSAELERLDAELKEAGVPPVCRSGYLLVVMGQVTEAHSDEDFRRILCPTLSGGEANGTVGGGGGSGSSDAGAGASGCVGASVSAVAGGGGGGRADSDGNLASATGGGAAPTAPAVPAGAGISQASLPEKWMDKEVADFCSQFKIEEPQRSRLIAALSKRAATFKEDLATLKSLLRASKRPPGLLSLRLREMENGTFQPQSPSPPAAAGRGRGGERPAAAQSRSREGRKERSKSKGKRRDDCSRSKDKKRGKDKDKSKDTSNKSRSRSRRRQKSSSSGSSSSS
mmetsp:Transcript_66361/g.215894  ORF Transcript_66361/g.215894 Transcript_66361/m.215894 type:complete len:520 (-) Transcript_66361:70-1629(-)